MAKILIAEDAAFMRMRCAQLLVELGHDVIEAEDGEEAVARFDADRPDAVLLDIRMPVMDGLEALRAIMARDRNARVAMVTAMGRQQVILEALKAGARDFVVKPFDADRLEETLWKLIT
jgi:two-component system chemotaxis response regulator CheY